VNGFQVENLAASASAPYLAYATATIACATSQPTCSIKLYATLNEVRGDANHRPGRRDKMSDDQIPFDHPELVANPEPRCACLLLLDTSGSMHGQPISELNAGLAAFKEELMADAMAVQRVEVGVISFGPVRVHSGYACIAISRTPIRGHRLGWRRAATPRWVPQSSRDCKCSIHASKSIVRAASPTIGPGSS